MNKKILSNIKNKITLATVALLMSAGVANAQTTENQIQDSLVKNKEYSKLLKTAKINEPQIKELEYKIRTTKAKMEVLQDIYYTQIKNKLYVSQQLINTLHRNKYHKSIKSLVHLVNLLY